MARKNDTRDDERERRPEPVPAEGAGAAGGGRTVTRIYQAIADAHRDFTDGTNRISLELNDALCRSYRDWVARQQSSQAEFQGHLDRGRLQQDLQKAGDAYWDEVRDLSRGATQRVADTYRAYLEAIKGAVAAIDVQSVDPGLLTFLAQTLNGAAAIAAQQPPVPRAA